MREIKFRVWNKFTKEIKSVDRLRFDSPIMEMQFMGNTYPYTPNPDDLILMQYTGLKDKNGKEIYEGDVLKHNKNTFFVRYSKNKYVLLLRDCNRNSKSWRNLEWCNNVSKYIEIIGNIHKKPELITQ